MTMHHRLLMAVCLISFLLVPSPSSAWWSELKPGNKGIHSRLSLLSQEMYVRHGIWFPEEVTEGSRDPDRKSHVQAALMHGQTFERARNSLCAGLTPWLRNDRRWAARRLARAFHYLQDHGDPTDQISGGRRSHVRELAFQLLAAKNRSIYGSKLWQVAFRRQQRIVARMDYAQVMNHLGAQARAIGTNINRHYDRFTRPSPGRDDYVRNQLLQIIATLNAAQNRVIELYANEAALQRSGQRGMCAAVNRRPPPRVAPPRPAPPRPAPPRPAPPPPARGMLYDIATPPYGGGRVCLTPRGVARIRSNPQHRATPTNIPCDHARD